MGHVPGKSGKKEKKEENVANLTCEGWNCDGVVFVTRRKHFEGGKSKLGQYCAQCGKWRTWLPEPRDYHEALEYEIHFGRNKGKKLKELSVETLAWYYENLTDKRFRSFIRWVEPVLEEHEELLNDLAARKKSLVELGVVGDSRD